MNGFDLDCLLYAMTHVARKPQDDDDRAFARWMVSSAQDPLFKPSRADARKMQAVESRFYREVNA